MGQAAFGATKVHIEKSRTQLVAKVGLLELDKPKSETHTPIPFPSRWGKLAIPGSSAVPDLSFGVGEEGPLPGRHPRYD